MVISIADEVILVTIIQVVTNWVGLCIWSLIFSLHLLRLFVCVKHVPFTTTYSLYAEFS